MARRSLKPLFSRSVQRSLTKAFGAIARTVARAAVKAVRKPAAKLKPATQSTLRSKPTFSEAATVLRSGMVVGITGALRYQLYKPPGSERGERLPLLVMLHGCTQDVNAIAASSRMNRIAARERFMVVYPEQDCMSNLQRCWNWFDTRSGRAQRESDAIAAAISQVCLTQPVDPDRIAITGFSAGAGMAALLSTRQPELFKAVIMHSGIAPGVAHSSATALSAMRGRRAGDPYCSLAGARSLPALLVIQGTADSIVAPINGVNAAQRWADHAEAQAQAQAQTQTQAHTRIEISTKLNGKVDAKANAKAAVRIALPRTVQRGNRLSVTFTDYRIGARVVVTLCEVNGLGHSWSGGAPGLLYSDPTGPDASRMVWAFAARQFAQSAI